MFVLILYDSYSLRGIPNGPDPQIVEQLFAINNEAVEPLLVPIPLHGWRFRVIRIDPV